ncbi:MAG: thioredoxin-like domain-containing protein [Planctomycetaceae bacterium]|nr:thioredoxin-like domain-containing protein [Planctomycetaceae bacterium]
MSLLLPASLTLLLSLCSPVARQPPESSQPTVDTESDESPSAGIEREADKSDESTKADDLPPADPAPDAVKVPTGILDGGSEWLNTSKPVDLADLRGKIVLVDFWTYCCINCIHVLPDLKFLEKKYEKELVVIGVHSAKFDNEKVSASIRDAILRYEIKHPVVNDDQMLIWRKFGARSWPTLALIDPEGRYVGSLSGEGNRDALDAAIARLATYHRWKGTLSEEPIVFELESAKVNDTDLRYPGKILADQASQRLFISDSNHNRIVVTSFDGQVQHIIGSGVIGRDDGPFDQASFDHPQGMELVGDLLYVADTENHLLRVVDLASKTVETLAGTGTQGRPRVVDGGLKTTNLNSPWDLCHINGVLYIAMAGPHQIWSHKLGSEKIGVHAGTAREDVRNGRLLASAFAQPSGLTVDGTGAWFFVADSEGSSIRRVPTATSGSVTTIAGASDLPRGETLFTFGDVDATGRLARFQHPLGVAWHDGAVYVADTYNHKIRRIDEDTSEVTTWLGSGTRGREDRQLNEPSGLSVAGDQLFIADTNNHRILVANLKTKDVRELKFSGFPQPEKTRRRPPLKGAVNAGEFDIQPGTQVVMNVALNIPLGGKLNTDAPMNYEIFLLEGDDILQQQDLNKQDEMVEDEGVVSFRLPLNESTGQAQIAVTFSFGYCETQDSDVCKLASGTWVMNVRATPQGETETILLSFPGAKADRPQAGDGPGEDRAQAGAADSTDGGSDD